MEPAAHTAIVSRPGNHDPIALSVGAMSRQLHPGEIDRGITHQFLECRTCDQLMAVQLTVEVKATAVVFG